MHIEWIHLKGFRNFLDSRINLREHSLIIGANDVGKTNLLRGLRLLLDRSLPDTALDPVDSDFHVQLKEKRQAEDCEILIKFVDVAKDAVRSILKGAVSDEAETFLCYRAKRSTLTHGIFVGASEALLEEVPSRHYLRYVNMRYVQSQRDLASFVQREKQHLLRLSKETRTKEQISEDEALLAEIGSKLDSVNSDIRRLEYVDKATTAVNQELQELSHHHGSYEVRLETGSIHTSQFIDQLDLAGQAGGRRVGLGGDGRNNQILMALWKAKSEREQDLENECVVFCIEEPEAHLHPHQQRKLAEYLVKRLKGQVLITTHSPQIASKFPPDSVVRLHQSNGSTSAASQGCSACVEKAWLAMSFRMSILPAEAFFSAFVLLVEGPSEVILMTELAMQMDIDLDRLNISILAVDGIDFEVYVAILKALEIPWAARTDNDLFKVQKSKPAKMRLAGINRAYRLLGIRELGHVSATFSAQELEKKRLEALKLINGRGVFLSKVDLESDLVGAIPGACMKFSKAENAQEAIEHFQERKAIRMAEFVRAHRDALKALSTTELADPLKYSVKAVSGK